MENRSINIFYWIWLIVIIGGIVEIVLGVLSYTLNATYHGARPRGCSLQCP
ncbi:MAG: hypothetical protein ACFFA5_08590 [Promethearchaeota archaeon]